MLDVAYGLGVGFIPARKLHKPFRSSRYEYDSEYGKNIEIHKDAIQPGDRIVIDDLLATGGTAGAVEKLVKNLQGELIGFEFD